MPSPSSRNADGAPCAPPSDAIERLKSCPHILQAIVAFADRQTQHTCLFVNREWHDVAGKYVYHTVTLEGDSAWSFMRGALVDDIESSMDAVKDFEPCDKHDEGFMALMNEYDEYAQMVEFLAITKASEKGQSPFCLLAVGHEGTPHEHTASEEKGKHATSSRNATAGKAANHKPTSDKKPLKARPDSAKTRSAEKIVESKPNKNEGKTKTTKMGPKAKGNKKCPSATSKESTAQASQSSSNPLLEDTIHPDSEAEEAMEDLINLNILLITAMKSLNRYLGFYQPGTRTLYETNFKKPLLANVRVPTLGDHHHCFCSLWRTHFGSFFPNLEVLRIAPPPCTVNTHRLHDVCDFNGRTCSIISNLTPRKIVFRNIDCNGLGIPPTKCWEPSASIREVVYFLPTDGAVWMDDMTSMTPLMIRLQGMFPNANAKAVFYDKWEGIKEAGAGSMDVAEQTAARLVRTGVPLDGIVATLNGLISPEYCIALPGACNCGHPNAHELSPGEFVPRKVEVYGLGRLRFMRSGLMWNAFCAENGGEITAKDLLERLKDEVVTGKYVTFGQHYEALASQYDVGPNFFEPLKRATTFYPLSAYLDNEDAREHEVTAE